MNLSFYFVPLAFLLSIELAQCKSILAIFPHFGKSHFYMYEPYIKELAQRGHKITLISPFDVSTPHTNIKVIQFKVDIPFENLNLGMYETSSSTYSGISELQLLNEWGQKTCTAGLSDPQIKEFVKSGKHFDLVVVEYFNTDCFAVFAHIFKAPLVGIFSSPPMPWHNDRMGNPDNPSYIVNMFYGFPSEMDFFTRVKNTLTVFYAKIYHKSFSQKPTDKIIKKHLGRGIPKISDIVKNTTLFLVNSHFSVFQPRPLVPGVVEVGGIHVQTPKSLPADLENYLSKSKNGVVYFSLGTVTKGASLPAKKRDAILRAFGNITQNVLWKWEDENMPNTPKNVLIKKWLPQNDLLAHPKVKVFITHAGCMSTLEAVTHGVPMIMIPLFGDQFLNAASIEEKGAGIVLDYFSINERKFLRTLQTVLEDKSYSENAKLLAARFKERPLTALNNAVYWTEYVLKFKGAPHLRSAVIKLPWYSEYLIDVALFIIVSLILALYVIKQLVIKFIAYRKASEDEKNKKKK